MSDLINVTRVINANIYLDGVSLLGRAEEVELAFPKARWLTIRASASRCNPHGVACL
jgi:hypothetical protein